MVAFRELKSFFRSLMNAHMPFMWENAGRSNYGGDPLGNYGAANAALAPGTKDERPPG